MADWRNKLYFGDNLPILRERALHVGAWGRFPLSLE